MSSFIDILDMKHCLVTLSSFADKAVFAGMYLGNVLSTVQQEKVMITKTFKAISFDGSNVMPEMVCIFSILYGTCF